MVFLSKCISVEKQRGFRRILVHFAILNITYCVSACQKRYDFLLKFRHFAQGVENLSIILLNFVHFVHHVKKWDFFNLFFVQIAY